MRSVAFLTLGCKVNSYETNGMEQLFLKAGFEIREFSEKADVYVINTCTVTNMADRKSRQMLHKARKNNPHAVIAAVGCYVQASYEEVKKDEAIDLVIGNSQKARIAEIVLSYLEDKKVPDVMVEMKNVKEYEEFSIQDAGEKTRAYIKIQDGCNQFCSYCIIPYVRGRIRSRKENEILDEIRLLAQKGYKEVVLTGIHLSSYGVDLHLETDFTKLKGAPLLDLMEKIDRLEGIERIRLGSLEPRIITKELITGLLKIKKLCPHFHLSLQSGCDETLKRMNRRYNTKEYLEKVELLKVFFDRPAVTTDIIVGFPGETREEFEETREFMKLCGFIDVHIFKYSKRKGTKAASLLAQVDESIKSQRSNALISLGEEIGNQYKAAFLETKQLVLVEEQVQIKDKIYYSGHNERYMKFLFPAEGSSRDLHNEIVEVLAVKLLEKGDILGSLI